MILGIDEAGKGCVIGDLVMCGVMVENDAELASFGVKDSKLLTPLQRKQIYTELIAKVKYKVVSSSPQEIDDAVNSKDGDNLNWLEAKKTAEIINELKPKTAIVDCPSTNTVAYADYLKKILIVDVELICEHKADVNYPSAAAASIIAKVVRDEQIEQLKKEIKVNFGSGYMSDPLTQKFLDEYWDKFPNIFRKSWKPYKNKIKELGQGNLNDF